MVFSRNKSVQGTIRADTAQRHIQKYTNKNPIHRYLLEHFFDVVADEIRNLPSDHILEFGCGEGLFLEKLKQRGIEFKSLLGIDLRAEALEHAASLHPDYRFRKIDILEWDYEPKSFDLVIASQVLEHLPNPNPVLKRLALLSRKHLLLTVPWEPWFRLVNLLRGRDLCRLGNHPEHVNLWGFTNFKRFVEKYALVTTARVAFPFTVVTARPH